MVELNKIYTGLSGIRFLAKRYTLKFLFIAFLGIHIPLIGLTIYLTVKTNALSVNSVIVMTLLLTLVSTAATLYFLRKLLQPLLLSKDALDNYLGKRVLPSLPEHHQDEAGILMQKIQETIFRLDQLLDEKKDLVGLIAHDLRTPLLNIKHLAQIMLEDGSKLDEIKTMASLIVESTDNQINLFHKVLDILKKDDLALHNLKLTEVEPTKLIKNILLDIEPMAQRKQIKIEVCNDLKSNLLIEPTLFPQVIKNLINNAIKFSNEHSTIRLELIQSNKINSIKVIDEGIGISEENTKELFSKFTGKSRLGTLNEASTGIGLYLSRKIIEAHLGRIDAYRNKNQAGSTFEIVIPSLRQNM